MENTQDKTTDFTDIALFDDEVTELLFGSGDTIFFDGDVNIFKITYDGGQEVGLTLDRFIAIL